MGEITSCSDRLETFTPWASVVHDWKWINLNQTKILINFPGERMTRSAGDWGISLIWYFTDCQGPHSEAKRKQEFLVQNLGFLFTQKMQNNINQESNN